MRSPIQPPAPSPLLRVSRTIQTASIQSPSPLDIGPRFAYKHSDTPEPDLRAMKGETMAGKKASKKLKKGKKIQATRALAIDSYRPHTGT